MKLDDLLARELRLGDTKDDALATRILHSLAAQPLPPQRQPVLWRWWPLALLNADFAPAWPRVAALACAACVGIGIGMFGVDTNLFVTRSNANATPASETDVASLFFEAEPLTGVRP
jgi:hypothetical protein